MILSGSYIEWLPVDADTKPAPTDSPLRRNGHSHRLSDKLISQRRSIFGYCKRQPVARLQPYGYPTRTSRAADEGIRSRPRDSRSGLECLDRGHRNCLLFGSSPARRLQRRAGLISPDGSQE